MIRKASETMLKESIHNSQDMEPSYMSIHIRMDKGSVVQTHNGILLIYKNHDILSFVAMEHPSAIQGVKSCHFWQHVGAWRTLCEVKEAGTER